MTSPTPYQQPQATKHNPHNRSMTPSLVTSPTPNRMWTPTAPKKISHEELNDFTERQMNYVKQKQARIHSLENRIYGRGNQQMDDDDGGGTRGRVRGGCVLTSAAHEESVSRQHDQEMKRREEAKKRLEEKYAPVMPKSVTMDSEAVQDIAKRMHEQAMRVQEKKKQMMIEKQKRIEEEAKRIEKGRKLGKAEIRTMGDRLCTPKKKLSYEEEQQRIFGKGVEIPAKFKAAARRIEEQEEEMRRAKLHKEE